VHSNDNYEVLLQFICRKFKTEEFFLSLQKKKEMFLFERKKSDIEDKALSEQVNFSSVDNNPTDKFKSNLKTEYQISPIL